MNHLFLETLRNFLAIRVLRSYSPNEAPVHTGRPGGRSEYVRPAAGHRTGPAPAARCPRGGRVPQERPEPEPHSGLPSDIAELLISELITNAVQISCANAQTTPVRLWMMANRTQMLILVWDFSPLPPVRKSTRQDDENGRGLLLVETLSTRWDWYFLP